MNNSYFQSFDNITFSDLWSDSDSFIQAYKDSGLPLSYTLTDGTNGTYLNDDDLSLIWTLMIGRFADSTIKPYNTFGAFKVRFMSRVWQHAPAWKKELEIQNKLRSMSLADNSDIYKGSSAIYNTALNPSTTPGTGTDNELNYINSQNVTKYKKSKLEGLAMLNDMLKRDVTEQFLKRFDDFFKTIIYTGRELYYKTEGDIE